MLELKKIIKDYRSGDMTVNALKGVSLSFRKSEFVAILGPSGCGKTTMLNIVGGLDRYTDGDLVINGRSTKSFRPYDWDAYRNNHVGFVFQSYNLISHQTVLGNVELALTLTGVSKAERRAKAAAALEQVGLKDQMHKRPNQLSGGQMQRVAIARAIVNEPSIILADEPTGALDSKTSWQIMDILKEIAKDRLIIMVTHNDDIAQKYSTRIVKLLDGEIISDTNPYYPTDSEREAALIADGLDPADFKEEPEEVIAASEQIKDGRGKDKESKAAARAAALKDKQTKKEKKLKEKEREKNRRKAMSKTAMKFTTALSLSGRNLSTKKGRTFLISLAGSIGIIGIALVLSIQNGFTGYINKMQTDMLSSVPLTVSQQYIDIQSAIDSGGPKLNVPQFPKNDVVTVYTQESFLPVHFNRITKEYTDYLTKDFSYDASSMSYYKNVSTLNLTASNGKSKIETVRYVDLVKNYSIEPNLVRIDNGQIAKVDTNLVADSRAAWQEMTKNIDFLNTQYDILSGHLPAYNESAEYQEVALVVDNSNRITSKALERIGITLKDSSSSVSYNFADFVGLEYKLLNNDNYYKKNSDGVYVVKEDSELRSAYNADSDKDIKIKISGIIRVKESAPISLYSPGLLYPQELTQAIISSNESSAIVTAQKAENNKGFAGKILFPGANKADNTTGLVKSTTISEAVAATLASSMSGTEGGSSMNAATLAPMLASLGALILAAEATPETSKSQLKTIMMTPAPMGMGRAEEEAEAIAEQFVSFAPMFATFLFQQQMSALNYVGGNDVPVSLTIYPLDFDTKESLKIYMNNYNKNLPDAQVIKCSDTLSVLGSTMNNLVNIISYVLVAFAAISLVVSSIMIAIITYVSVIERTKEIGVLRSIGARKKDITRVFNAETVIIGLIAGTLGVAISYLLTIPINLILNAVIKSNAGGMMVASNLANLNPFAALALIGISVVLTLVSGLIPAFMAAKKDPVVALRTE